MIEPDDTASVPDQPLRMKLICYIDDDKNFIFTGATGVQEYSMIFLNSPDVWYAIVQINEQQYWLVDMSKSLQVEDDIGGKIQIGEYMKFRTLNAAMMAAKIQ